MVEQERQRNAELPIDSLIALSARIQREAASAKRTLEALTEAGLVEAHGSTKGRSYTLSVAVYQHQGNKAAYTRQKGFSGIQNEQMVLNFVRQHGRIKRSEAMELCRLSNDQAFRLLKKLLEQGQLIAHGERRGSHYTLPLAN